MSSATDRDFVRLQRVFREVLENDVLELKGDDTDASVEGWDSFAHVKLVIGLQEEFEVEFSIDEVAETKQIGALLKLIEKKKTA